LKKNAKFLWTHDTELAFEKLKQALTDSVVLVFPDFEKSFVIQTDASGKGIGAILSQINDNK